MAENLEALATEAAALDAELQPAAAEATLAETTGPDAAPPPPDPVESLAGFIQVAAIAAEYGGLKRTAALWKPETCRGLSERLVPVLAKYAWGQRVLAFLATGAGVEELALAAYAAPLVLSTLQAVREDLKPAHQIAPVIHDEPRPIERDPGRPE